EALGHVAHLALDERRLGGDVVPEAGAAPGVGREQAAKHADRGGLAAAVGAEEAVDLPARHLHREVVDDGLRAEALGEALDVDGEARGAAHGSLTSTGCPGCRRAAWAASGSASTR